MEMKIKYLFFLLIILIFCKCSDSTSPTNDEKVFGIYLLKDTTLITSDAKKLPLEFLQVQEKPIVNITNIIEYNWSEQKLTLTQEAFNEFKTIDKKIKSTYGLPFMVMVYGHKIYLGNLYPLNSSYIHEDFTP